MKFFYYKLESVLNFRKLQQEQCQSELAAAVRIWENEERRRRQIDEELLQAIRFRTENVVSVTADKLRQWDNYCVAQREKRQAQSNACAAALVKVQECRRELAGAMREVRKLENHRECRLQEWRDEESRRESRILDEVGVLRAFRAAAGVGTFNPGVS